MSARAMTSAMTPTPTPRMDTAEMSEMNACRRRAVRYRRATNQANDSELTSPPWRAAA